MTAKLLVVMVFMAVPVFFSSLKCWSRWADPDRRPTLAQKLWVLLRYTRPY